MAGGAQTGDDELITSINVTPLVDIILVLLIIFMVTTEVIHESEKPRVIPVDLPEAASAEEMLSKGLLNLVIDQRGDLYLNGEKADFDALQGAIAFTRKQKVKPQAMISADQRITHGEVATLMDFLRLQRVTKIALNTKRQTIE